MKIAYVLKKFPRLSETFILNEILGLEELGYEVVVFTLKVADDEPRHGDLEKLKAQIVLVPKDSDGGVDDHSQQLGALIEALPEQRRRRIVAQGRGVLQLCADHSVDHLHAHFMTVASHVAAVCRLSGGPSFSVTAHAKDIFRHGINKGVFRLVAKAAKSIVTVSHFNRRYIIDRFLSECPEKVRMVYNGLPLEDSSDVGPRIEREENHVLAVGRLVEKKGFDILIRACHLLRQSGHALRLSIVGQGDEQESLAQLVHDLELDDIVTMTGPLPREEVKALMERAKVFVLPCREGKDGNRDALPTVLIEALSCGLPVVSTLMVGIPEIVGDDECGILVPVDDFEATAVAMESLLDDQILWSTCSERGPIRARELFDRRKTLPQIVQVFADQETTMEHPGGIV